MLSFWTPGHTVALVALIGGLLLYWFERRRDVRRELPAWLILAAHLHTIMSRDQQLRLMLTSYLFATLAQERRERPAGTTSGNDGTSAGTRPSLTEYQQDFLNGLVSGETEILVKRADGKLYAASKEELAKLLRVRKQVVTQVLEVARDAYAKLPVDASDDEGDEDLVYLPPPSAMRSVAS